MLFRIAAAAGRRAAHCARPRRPVDLAGRPPSDSQRRAEQRLAKLAGACWLAHWWAAAPGLEQAQEGSICCGGGAERLICVHDRVALFVCATGRRNVYKTSTTTQVAADGKEQLLVDSKDLDRVHDRREGDGQCSKMRLSSRGSSLVAHSLCVHSVQDEGINRHAAAVAVGIWYTLTIGSVQVPRS